MELPNFFYEVYFDNQVIDYLWALVIFILSFATLNYFVRFWLLRRIQKLTKKTGTKFDDLISKAIKKVGSPFYLALSLLIAVNYLSINPLFQRLVSSITIVIFAYYIVKGLQEIVVFLFERWTESRKAQDGEDFDPSFIGIVKSFTNVFIWLFAVVFVLQNFNVNVAALVGGLGITGVAIAFALQNVLGDIFASFSIYLDKPFQTGDFIIVGQDMGTVKKIGIASTRIKTLQGQELSISNHELVASRINNYTRMASRRVDFQFGINYDTTSEKLKQIPDRISKIIENTEICVPNRVHFKEFADWSLLFEVVYTLNSESYEVYMDVQQKINLEIKALLEKMGVEMAFPTQTVILQK